MELVESGQERDDKSSARHPGAAIVCRRQPVTNEKERCQQREA